MTLLIEAGFGYAPTSVLTTWTDITQWVDLRQSIRISRGASDELSQIQAGTLGLTLDNTDGRFTPGNASSPYYPYVRPGCPIRVSKTVGGTTYYRFYGMVTDWNQGWTGLQDRVRVGAVDLFGLLSGDEQLQALIVEEILLFEPLAYYPLSEPSGSASAGDIAGSGSGSLAVTQTGVGGTLEFGEGTGPPADGLSTPLFTPASATAGKYLLGDLGQPFDDASSANYMFMECWFSTSTTGRVLFSVRSQDSQYQIIFSLESGTGKLQIQYTSSGGPLGGFGISVAATANLADGAVHYMMYDEQAGRVYIDGDVLTGHAVAVDGMLRLRHLTVGAYANDRLWSGTISHLALHAPIPPAGAGWDGRWLAGTTGFAGEDSAARVARLAGYAGIPGFLLDGVFTAVASQGEGGQTALEMMRVVEETEDGKLAATREGPEFLFQARSVRYNAASALSLAYADLETGDVESTSDTQKLVNTVTALRPGGATQRVANASSRLTYGPKRRELNILKMTDAEVLDAAWWLVSRYADPPPEIRQVPVEASTLGDATYGALLDADISTVFTITDLPATAPSPTATVTVEGYVETIGQSSHRIDFHTSRTNTNSVWVLGSSTYSVLGSTTRLAY